MESNFGFVRVSAVSPKVVVGDPIANIQEMRKILDELEDSSIVVFPELGITGYTCGDLFGQDHLLQVAKKQLFNFAKTVMNQLVFVGVPLIYENALYNCAVAINDREIIGIIPKSYLPNYKEFYEARWFHPAIDMKPTYINMFGSKIPFGTDLIFEHNGIKVFAEVCEDIWMPIPPSSHAAIAGANILINLSASNETVAKADYRKDLVVNQSARCMAAYIYSSCGPSESTSDLVFGGHCLIAENGSLLAESNRVGRNLKLGSYFITQEIDVESLDHDRRQTTSFAYSPSKEFRKVKFYAEEHVKELKHRQVNGDPFIPQGVTELVNRCNEIIDIAVCGLVKRLEMLQNSTKLMIGVSGGLDSTLALLFLHRAAKMLKIEDRILAYTMPGFGTTDRTLSNAVKLMNHMGIQFETIDIRPICIQMFKDLKHKPFGVEWNNETVLSATEKLSNIDPNTSDLVFENVQARARTNLLMNKGFVIGTGDLSEIALGWCTYNADHMSMYNPNCSIPKSLVQFLIKYLADTQEDNILKSILYDIFQTPISPELLPTNGKGESLQVTESVVGSYELNDFFLFNFIRKGFSPEKIRFLAKYAKFFINHSDKEIDDVLKSFYTRFFRNQFKRNCVPDGPKVGSVSLSPRGDWRMPSDASSAIWT